MNPNSVILRDVPQLGGSYYQDFPFKRPKIVRGYTIPQIAIKSEDTDWMHNSEVLLVNGCWDTSGPIPNIIAEMHNIPGEDLNGFHNLQQNGEARDFLNPSPRGSDSGIESDCTDGNLSWLLNYKIHELPPVPDTSTENLGYSSGANGYQLIVRNDEYGDIESQTYRYAGPKKPPFTYTELIEHALTEKGELTVSGIYQWISEHFPFYKQNDDRWKNSVRHNLSINPHFRKGGKAVHGAGHLWTIAQKDDKKTWQIKKQRMQQFIQAAYKESNNKTPEEETLERELQAATASILGETYNEIGQNAEPENEAKENIEVEFINIVDVQTGLEDFLCPPVSKQQIVQECGLGNDFLITDLNPNTLGLSLADGEVITDGSFYDDISFEYYELEKE